MCVLWAAASTGSIRGAVRALFRAQACASANPAADMEQTNAQPSGSGRTDSHSRGAFQEVPLSDSPR